MKSIETYDPKTRKRLCKNYRYGLTVINNEKYESVWGGGAIKHIVTERDYCSTVTQVMDDGQSLWNEYLTVYHSMPVSNITFRNGSPVMYNIVKRYWEEAFHKRPSITMMWMHMLLRTFCIGKVGRIHPLLSGSLC